MERGSTETTTSLYKDMDLSSITDTTNALPLPAMHTLMEIRKALTTTYLPPTKRAARVKSIVEHDAQFLKELLRVADQCLDLDDDESLELLFQITKALCAVLHLLLSDTYFLDVVGILEFNPHTIRKMCFRKELSAHMTFNEVIPITDPQVVQAIHVNYRIDAIKDNILSRSLADGCTIWLESIVNENNISILTYISNHEEYMVQLRALVADRSTESTGLLLLQNVMRLIQITQPPSRGTPRVPHMLKADYSGMNPVFGSLHHALFPTTLLPSFAAIVTRANDTNRLLVLEMLHHLVLFQNGDLLRVYMADERGCCDLSVPFSLSWEPHQSLLLAILVAFVQAEAARGGVLDVLKHLFHVVPGRDDKFLHMLYHGNYMHWWVHLLGLPDQTGNLYELHASVWEVLTMCVSHHGYRIKYLLAKIPIAAYATDALGSGNKLRVLHVAAFLRACVLRNETFYSNVVATPAIWDAIVDLLHVRPRNPSAVVSALLEMIMSAEAHNCRLIMQHIVTHAKVTLLEAAYPGVITSIKAKLSDGQPEVHNGLTIQEEERYWAQEEQTMVVVVDEVDDKDDTTGVVVVAAQEDQEGGGLTSPPPLIPLQDREETGIIASSSSSPVGGSTRRPKKQVKNMFSSIQWSSPSKKQKVDL
ncbi:hypothetical protein DYB30_006767 [Aphanomyces astaci]|uniref:Serine/threonine-protein phosphatase 4 regulatory subunit 3-like central domain-containing protein n=1 Tax=Aphanomyces astaci TaxID=112090 RepID=A0A397D1G6_APHAT|nr:hypothetical protein DYB30_006767 [Aphanomyces astaci]